MSVAIVVYIKRRPGISEDEFSRHWREIHAPLIRGCAEFSRHLVSYTQYHLADRSAAEAGLFGGHGGYDGVAVLEFPSLDIMQQAFAEPAYLEQIRPDEPNFVDLENCVSFISEPFRVL